jgi:hypothetical protein
MNDDNAQALDAQKAEPDAVGYDPWEGYPPNYSERPGVNPEASPLHWGRLFKRTRERIGAEAVAVLAECGPATRDPGRLAHLLRERLADDPRIGADLFQPEIGDSFGLLQSVIVKLTVAGDVAAALQGRIERAHQQLARIDRIRGAAPAKAKVPA